MDDHSEKIALLDPRSGAFMLAFYAQLQKFFDIDSHSVGRCLQILRDAPIFPQDAQLGPQDTPVADFQYKKASPYWHFTVSGQTLSIGAPVDFTARNISAPDFFGPGGPGTSPDAISDDYVRLVGVNSKGETNRYAVSEYFKIRQGQTATIQNLTFTDTPPKKPYSLAALPDQAFLTAIGQTTQMHVTAAYPDNTTGDVTPATGWTSYRTSNVDVARVDANGVVTAMGAGIAYITAVNDGASAVAGVFVQRPDPLTTIKGFVRLPSGLPVSGATVTLVEYGSTTTSIADGSFTFSNVPTTSGILTLRAAMGALRSPDRQYSPVGGGIVDAGILVLEQAIVSIPSGTPYVPGIALGSGITLASFPSLAGTVIADTTNALTQPYLGSSQTMCYLGKTRRIPQYLSASYSAAGALLGPCPPPEATETQSGKIRSLVVRRSDNGALDFYYQLINENSLVQARYDFFRVVILGMSSFPFTMSYRNDGLAGIAGANNVVAGTRAPSTADRDFGAQGLGIGFSSFLGNSTNLRSRETSRFIVVRTSATAFGQTQALVSTADTLFAQVYAPAQTAPVLSPAIVTALGSGDGISLNPPADLTAPGADNLVRLSALTRSEAGAQFQFPTEAGRHYRLEGTPDLASGQWEVLLDQLEGTGGPLQVTDPNATGTRQYFYRIILLP